MTEVWRPVLGWEGRYEASSLGRVRSLPRVARAGRGNYTREYPGHVLQPRDGDGRGRVKVCLTDGKRRRNLWVHRVVFEAFVGPLCPGEQVNHINGDKQDNSILNLETCTNWGNMRHAIENGLTDTRLDPAAVRDIRARVEIEREPLAAIAEVYGVAASTVRAVIQGKTWGHVQDIEGCLCFPWCTCAELEKAGGAPPVRSAPPAVVLG